MLSPATIGTVSTYRSPLLDHPGAAENQDPGLIDALGVPWHYGDPFAEQRRDSALIDRSHRTVLHVTGADAAQFLNNLLSQKLDALDPGTRTVALDLDMQGRILHQVDVAYVDENDFYLDLPASDAATFRDFLTKMVFWSEVTIEESDLALVTLFGARPDFPTAWALPVSSSRIDAAVPRASLGSLSDSTVPLAGLMAFTAARVAALEPERRADLDERSIPHEAAHWIGRHGRLGAVHLEKGCYRGQETVARVENLGRAPRLLLRAHLDGSAPKLPVPGDPITSGKRTVGRVGTVVHDHELGPVALVLLKRSAADASGLVSGDTALMVDADSFPTDEGERLGRKAVDQLRGRK